VNARGFLADPATVGTKHKAWSNGGWPDVAMYHSGWFGPSNSTDSQRRGFRINGPAAFAAFSKGSGTTYARPVA
jgi:hypothetical protein